MRRKQGKPGEPAQSAVHPLQLQLFGFRMSRQHLLPRVTFSEKSTEAH